MGVTSVSYTCGLIEAPKTIGVFEINSGHTMSSNSMLIGGSEIVVPSYFEKGRYLFQNRMRPR